MVLLVLWSTGEYNFVVIHWYDELVLMCCHESRYSRRTRMRSQTRSSSLLIRSSDDHGCPKPSTPSTMEARENHKISFTENHKTFFQIRRPIPARPNPSNPRNSKIADPMCDPLPEPYFIKCNINLCILNYSCRIHIGLGALCRFTS